MCLFVVSEIVANLYFNVFTLKCILLLFYIFLLVLLFVHSNGTGSFVNNYTLNGLGLDNESRNLYSRTSERMLQGNSLLFNANNRKPEHPKQPVNNCSNALCFTSTPCSPQLRKKKKKRTAVFELALKAVVSLSFSFDLVSNCLTCQSWFRVGD